MNLYDNNLNSNNNNNQNSFDIYKQSNYNNQYSNQQFYQVYNDSFKNTKKRPSALIIILIVILCSFGIWFILGLFSLAPTLSTAKISSFQNEASDLVTAAKTYIVTNNIQESGNFVFVIGEKNATWYSKSGASKIVDNTLREDLIESPFGNKYKTAFVKVEYNHSGYYADYYLYLSDGKYCFNGIKEENLTKEENISKDCKNFISNPSTAY